MRDLSQKAASLLPRFPCYWEVKNVPSPMSNLNLCYSSPNLLFLVSSVSNVDNELFLPPSSIFRSLKVVVIEIICTSRICRSKMVLKRTYFNMPNCGHREGAVRGM